MSSAVNVMNYTHNMKGLLATATTFGAVGVSWVPAVEAVLRCGVSVVGIIAGIYAVRYWRAKNARLDKPGKQPKTDV